jgi:hypothetical protein
MEAAVRHFTVNFGQQHLAVHSVLRLVPESIACSWVYRADVNLPVLTRGDHGSFGIVFAGIDR